MPLAAFVSFLLVIALGGALLTLLPQRNALGSLTKPPAASFSHSLHPQLEDAAVLEDVRDPATVRALVEQLFLLPQGRLRQLPDASSRDHLIAAETAHLGRRRAGLSERDLTTLFNAFMDQIAAPPFARATAHQFRALRLHLSTMLPQFVGHGIPEDPFFSADAALPPLSPAQAAYLFVTMAEQKSFNACYQLSPSEWERTEYDTFIAAWSSMRRVAAARVERRVVRSRATVIARAETDGQKEMRTALASAPAPIDWFAQSLR